MEHLTNEQLAELYTELSDIVSKVPGTSVFAELNDIADRVYKEGQQRAQSDTWEYIVDFSNYHHTQEPVSFGTDYVAAREYAVKRIDKWIGEGRWSENKATCAPEESGYYCQFSRGGHRGVIGALWRRDVMSVFRDE